MHFIKFKTFNQTSYTDKVNFINGEEISTMSYDGISTEVVLKTGKTYNIQGDYAGKIARIMTTATMGNVTTLE